MTAAYEGTPGLVETREAHGETTLVDDPARDLPAIPGQPPNLEQLGPGCAFAARCERAVDNCLQSVPALARVGPQQVAACHRLPGA